MKTRAILLLLIYLISSCKKECNNINNISLINKVKSLKQYNLVSTDTVKFYFYYDSLTGDLKSVRNDTILLTSICKIDDHTILVYDNTSGKTLSVNVNGKHILSISNGNALATQFYFKNDAIDSISDVGNFYNSNINYYNFLFENENCSHYSTNYIVNIFGAGYKEYNADLKYTNKLNDNQIYSQHIGAIVSFPDGQNNYISIANYLGISGYYAVKPNRYLLDSIVFSNSYLKYDYIFENNKVKKVTYTTPNGKLIDEYTYY